MAAVITMWRRGDRRCVLVVENDHEPPYRLRIVEGTNVLRDESMRSADSAAIAAQGWQTEELTH